MAEAINLEKNPRRFATNAVWTGGAQASKLIITVLLTIVVSRLLPPDDFGVIAMIAPITAFVLMFQELGLSQAIVQAKEIEDEKVNSLFWISFSVSILIATIILLLSPLISLFYNDGRTGLVASASVIPVLITALGLQHTALLEREMRFPALALVDIANAATNLFVTIGLAYFWKSYWVLFVGTTSGTCVQTILLWSFNRWRPRAKINLNGTRGMLTFGGNLAAFNMVNFWVRNLDNILIAKYFGSVALGLYDRSYRIMMLPITGINYPIGRVMLPTLSKLRDNPEKYRKIYIITVRFIMFVITPGVALSVVLSKSLMVFLLGDQWEATGSIFFWLGFTGLLQPIANPTGWLFISSGRTQAMLRLGIISASMTAIGFVLAIPWGTEGIAASLFVTLAIRMPIIFSMSCKGTSVSSLDMYKIMIEPSLTILAIFLIVPHVNMQVPYLIFIISMLFLSYVISIMSQLVTSEGRAFLKEIYELIFSYLMVAKNRLEKRSAV
jgi:PST family polysaccharide transporter